MITPEDIARAVSRNALQKGFDYFNQGRVLSLDVLMNGRLIESVIAGSGDNLYGQTIELRAQRGGPTVISGDCDCPVGENCKHVAAALLAYLEDRGEDNGEDSRLDAETPLPPPQPVVVRPPVAPPAPPTLTPDLLNWLDKLQSAETENSEDYPAHNRKRLIYVLNASETGDPVTLELASCDMQPDGSLRPPSKLHEPYRLLSAAETPKYIRPSDRAILRRLVGLGDTRQPEFIETLRAMIATGRARWGSHAGPVLHEGPPVAGEPEWRLREDAAQYAAIRLPDGVKLLQLSEPWCADTATGAVGPVASAVPPQILKMLLAAPAIAPDAAALVRAQIAQRMPGVALPAPHIVPPPREVSGKLQPVLHLIEGTITVPGARMVFRGRHVFNEPSWTETIKLARLCYRYGPVTLAVNDERDTLVLDGERLKIARNRKRETECTKLLQRTGMSSAGRMFNLPASAPHATDFAITDPSPDAWVDFRLNQIPKLRDQGWLIDIAADFPLRLAIPSSELTVEIEEGSGIDWFELDLGVMVDGARISLVPPLLDFISRTGFLADPGAAQDIAKPLLLPLPDGRLLAIPFKKLQPVLAPLLELFSASALPSKDGKLRLQRRQAADLAALEQATAGAGLVWRGGDAVRMLGKTLRAHAGIPPCVLPETFNATLRGYQAQGLAWLQFLAGAGLGGILADDMGLGKTVQALAHLTLEQANGRLDRPALVICPTSLVANWRNEAARFAPSLRTLVLHGPERAKSFPFIAQHDLVITTYPLLTRDHATYAAQDWHLVMLDEAQIIKNPLANVSKLARTLNARQRLCLSGTPLENHLGELWSLFDFLMPGFLGDTKSFTKKYRTPIEKAGNEDRRVQLASRVTPFMLRRTKQDVAADLPAKTNILETVEMEAGQRAVYESIRLSMHQKVRAAIAKRGLAGSGIIILDALLKLRQACCDPRLLKLTSTKITKPGSAKLERLLELLPSLLEDGRRILLFSQFTSMLELIEEELNRLAIPYALLTGETKDRGAQVEDFQMGRKKLFLISLKAGGTGLNLTAADTVIHYDPWWNPAVEDQATDRAHRIGQNKPVFVHRLITAGTIEEKMQVLKERKQALAAGILGDTAAKALALTESDLDMLFET